MPYKKGGGRNCAVYKCSNNQRKLGQWRDDYCMIHAGLTHIQCPCPEPFRFCNIPQVTKSGDDTRRLQWLKAIQRLNLPPTRGVVCSNHFVDGCPTIMNPLPTLNIEPPPKDKESKKKSTNSSKLASKSQKSIIERSLFIKAQGGYQEQQQNIMNLETLKSTLQRSPNKVLEQLQSVEESRNEKLLKAMLYQMTPQTQSKLQQKINISAALGKPANTERSRKSPLDTASTSNSTLATKPIEVEDSSPPIKKAREIHIDIDISEDESTVVSKPPLQPAIPVESPVQKSVTTSVKPTPVQPSSVVHNPVLDINVPQKQKRILVVPNHQQSVMSNLSSLWKAGRLCDAFISNGTSNVEVHKMILGAVCPKVLDVFYNTPQHKLPKVTFPNSVSKEALLSFVEYMYNGVLDLDPDMLIQMKVIAKQLDMKDFEQLCNNQLKSTVVQNMLPSILEPMLSEPCSSSGLLQQMSLEGIQTSVMDIISAPARNHQKNVHTVDTLHAISSTTNNSCSSFSNLPLKIRGETNDTLMEAGINNIVPSIVHNTCDININNRLPVKTEEVDPDDQQYGRETVSSGLNYSTPDSIITNNFTHFSNSDLSKSSSSPASTTQPTNSTLNKPLPVGHIWKQNSKDKGNLTENANPTDPYPINLFTANWINVPLLTQEIKKEYSVD